MFFITALITMFFPSLSQLLPLGVDSHEHHAARSPKGVLNVNGQKGTSSSELYSEAFARKGSTIVDVHNNVGGTVEDRG
jgi:hypothetical protein